jgi:hypothetical protein
MGNVTNQLRNFFISATIFSKIFLTEIEMEKVTVVLPVYHFHVVKNCMRICRKIKKIEADFSESLFKPAYGVGLFSFVTQESDDWEGDGIDCTRKLQPGWHLFKKN